MEMSENLMIRGKIIAVNYVPKQSLYPLFGLAWIGLDLAWVREDLSLHVKRFVLAHEIYHLTDEWTWGGWIGRELRANVMCGIKDPKGFFATIIASCTWDRIKFYIRRLQNGM